MPLVILNTTDHNFAIDLEAFDEIPTRNHDTVFLFYVKSGQKERAEVLQCIYTCIVADESKTFSVSGAVKV